MSTNVSSWPILIVKREVTVKLTPEEAAVIASAQEAMKSANHVLATVQSRITRVEGHLAVYKPFSQSKQS